MKKLFILLIILFMGVILHGFSPQDFTQERAPAIFNQTLASTVNFWTSPEVIDSNGGYWVWFDENGKKCDSNPHAPNASEAQKPLISQLRVLYAHAEAIPRATTEAERIRLKAQYEHGFKFITEKYVDPKSGFFVKALTEKGDIFQGDLVAISQIYVIYMMSEIADLISDRRAFDLAEKTFLALDKVAYDKINGGYFEDLTLKDTTKSVGSNLHAALGFSKLMKIKPTKLLRQRLDELFTILTSDKILHPSGNGYMLMTAEWQVKPNSAKVDSQVLYGHNAELLWYLLETAEALRIDVNTMIPWMKKISQPIIEYGIFADGKAAIFGPFVGNAPEVNIPRWWTQLELMNMLIKLYQVTGEAQYYELFQKVSVYSYNNLVDPNSNIWYGAVDLTTKKRYYQGGWAWKSGLHVIRAMKLINDTIGKLETPWKPVRKYKTAKDLPKKAIQVSLGYPYNHDRSAESLVSEIKSQGYDAIFIIIKEKEIKPANLVEVARKNGLQVWGSFFGPATFMPDSLFPPESKDWRMEFTVKRGNRYFSYVHKAYQEWWKTYLNNFYDQHQFDGFVFYESHYGTRLGLLAGNSKPWFGDISPGFVEHFKKNTRHQNFPNFTDPDHEDYYLTNRELYNDYIEYRVKSINEFHQEIWDGKNGLRRKHPEVTFGTWTIALAGNGALEDMREAEAQDSAAMVSAIRGDFHFIQSHWPDWIPEKQKPDYMVKYRPYMESIWDAFPNLPLALQGDFASTVPYRRSPEWVAEFDKNAHKTGFDFTTFYEFQVRYQIYYDAPKVVSAEINQQQGKVIFDQVIGPKSVKTFENRTIGNNCVIKNPRTDGNWLFFDIDGVIDNKKNYSLDVGTISDYPEIRVPMPAPAKRGKVNIIPENTIVNFNIKDNNK